jgi:hypothetical protein
MDLDGASPGLRAWYSLPGDEPLPLPLGRYLIISVLTTEPTVVHITDLLADVPANYVPSQGGQPEPDPELAAAIEELALFLLDAEAARLTALEANSAGFLEPLFESTALATGHDLISLSRAYQTAAAHEPSVSAALATLEASGVVAKADRGPGLARPLEQDSWWDGIKDQFTGFFGEVSASNERSVDRMRQVAAEMTPGDKEQAFDAIPADSRGDAQDFDDMLDRAERGDLPIVATNLEGLLNDDVGYEPIARDQGLGAGQVLQQEGARLVVKGVELQIAITQTMLDAALPGISRGAEIADQIKEYLDYAAAVYNDPLGEAEAYGRDLLAGAIADRLGQALEDCCADVLSEEERQELAEGLGGSIVEQVPEFAGGESPAGVGGQGGSGAGPAPPPTEQVPANVTVSVNGFFTENVDPSTVSLSTRLVLVADFEAGFVSGSLTGSGDEGTVVECRADGGQGALLETSEWNGVHVYDTEFTADLDTITGEFSAPLSITGSTDWTQITQYQHPSCTHLNTGSASDSWGGSGSVEGIVAPDGGVQLTTSWQSSNRTTSGTFTGSGSVETP